MSAAAVVEGRKRDECGRGLELRRIAAELSFTNYYLGAPV